MTLRSPGDHERKCAIALWHMAAKVKGRLAGTRREPGTLMCIRTGS